LAGRAPVSIRSEDCFVGVAMATATLVAVTLVTFVISLTVDAPERVALVLQGTALFAIATVARRSIRRTTD
jgi:hypothetical protein